jgi:hypothetical protein
LLPDPSKEGGFVNQNAAADASNYGIKPVGLRVKDERAKTAERRPGMLLSPLLDREEAGFGRRCR